MTTVAVTGVVARWRQVFKLLRDERGIFESWSALVEFHDVKGKNAHDARLVAAMQRHNLTHLLTFNQSDFTRFTNINALTPSDINAGKLSIQNG